MTRRVVARVVAAQAGLVVGLAACVVVHPSYVLGRDEGGVSNYGVHPLTGVIYTLAFALDAGLLTLAARATPRTHRAVRTVLGVDAALVVATLASTYPYQHGEPWHDLHVVVGAALLCFQLAASLWLVRGIGATTRGAVVAQAIGVALGALAIAGVARTLFVGQAVATVAFAGVLVAGVRSRLAR
ncbi:MAG: hypothetical protein ACRDV0_05550 [Acidimicrobiales bacterium]